MNGRKPLSILGFQRSRKTLVSLYPQHEGFVVQIVLGQTLADAVSQRPSRTNVRRTPEGGAALPSGQMLFIKVSSNEDSDDVKEVAAPQEKPGE